MSDHAIHARGLAKRFRTGRTHVEVLKGIDFVAPRGAVTMVMGPSGSGKSTLVAALSGLLRPDAGQVEALGRDLWSLDPRRIDRFRLDHCGFIFQGFNLFPALSASRQVETVLRHQGVGAREAKARAAAALEAVGLTARAGQRPDSLSGGEKQRVAIARALAKRPDLIFADEPTSALDTENGQLVVGLLRRAASERNAAVVCVTHDHRLEAFADAVVHMEDGMVLEPAPPSDPGSNP